MQLRRTMLFIPGNNPGMLQNAGILGADSVILDLEDAVSLMEKDTARILVREALKNLDYSGTEVVVRINPLSTAYWQEDLEAIIKSRLDTILVPKATAEDMAAADRKISELEKKEGLEVGTIKLIALIETAYGLETVYEVIKATERVTAVLLGGEDLTTDLGIKRTKEGEEIFYARNRVAVACKAARIDAIDTPFTDTEDIEGLERDTRKAKSLGMTGKAAINPRQVDTIHEVYAPTIDEIKHALRVLDAMEEASREGKGVFSLNGKMVDAPIVNRAKAVVDLAERLHLIQQGAVNDEK